MATLPKRPFEELAHAMSAMPSLIEQLLAAHPAAGICPGCTMPGGRTVIDAPCPIRKLALMAAQIREAANETRPRSPLMLPPSSGPT